MTVDREPLNSVLESLFTVFDHALTHYPLTPSLQEIGTIKYVGQGIARITGLPHVQAEELVRFPGAHLGMALNLDPEEIGVILLDESPLIQAGVEVRRTGQILHVPVGDALLGRIVDALGRPLDNQGPVQASNHYPVEREAPAILDRARPESAHRK